MMNVKNPNVWKTVLEFLIASLSALAAPHMTPSRRDALVYICTFHVVK